MKTRWIGLRSSTGVGRALPACAARAASRWAWWAVPTLLLAAPAFGQTAGMLSFQGLIKDAGGVPVRVPVTLEFRIFDASASGALVAGPFAPVTVTPTNGVVSTKFGPVAPGAFDGTPRWLEVSADGLPLSRIELATAPAVAEQLNTPGTGTAAVHVDANGRVGVGTASPGSPLTVAGLIETTAGGVKYPDGTIQTTAPVPVAASPWLPSGNDIFYTAGSVGIGTAGPLLPPVPATHVLGTRLPTRLLGLACATDSTTGRIYCFGGQVFGGVLLDQIVEYDPATGIVTTKAAVLPSPRSQLACAADPISGKIYCFGGAGPGILILDEIVEYDPATDTAVTKAAVLPSPRSHLACAADPTTGRIYCFGGFDGANADFDEIVEYDPATDTVVTKAAVLPSPIERLACAADPITGNIYCFGGRVPSSGQTDEIVEYNPATDTVVTKATVLPWPRESLSCAADAPTGKIYCFGGSGGLVFGEITQYDPGTDTLVVRSETLPSLATPSACAASALTGKIYSFGGGGTAGDQIVEFDPAPNPSTPASLQVGDPGDGSGALANGWNVFSSRSFKQDITPLDRNEYETILDKLNATDVVRFRYASDRQRTPHLGVIAEEAPREIVGPGRQSVSLADYSAFLLAAIKAQQAELDRKTAHIEEIQARLDRLESRMAEPPRERSGHEARGVSAGKAEVNHAQ